MREERGGRAEMSDKRGEIRDERQKKKREER